MVDLVAGELDPSFDALEHLDLKGCEDNGQMCAIGEGEAAVEI